VIAPRTPEVILVMVGLYGLLAYTLYSVAVAHANDHAPAGKFVQVSSGLLMLYGIGTMIGPLIAGFFMNYLRPESLFLATAGAHVGVAAYAAVRISRRPPVPAEAKDTFTTQPAERLATPQAIQLNPRADVPADGGESGAEAEAN
jgi:MFS family permease